MTTSLGEFIQEKTQLYQRHLSSRNKAKQTLQYQSNIRAYKTIPKQYLPQKSLQLLQPTTPLVADFQRKYEDLFFDHLNGVISNNTITLELEEAVLKQTVLYTEKHLATSKEDTPTVARFHQQFIIDNNILNHDIHPLLLQRLPEIPTPTTSATKLDKSFLHSPVPKRATKRKRPNLRGNRKRQKTDPSPIHTATEQRTQASQLTSSQQHFLDLRRVQSAKT